MYLMVQTLYFVQFFSEIFKYFLVSTSPYLLFPIWRGKRDNHFSRHNVKVGKLMKPSGFQKFERNRETSLMCYFLEMNNEEISKSRTFPEAVYSKIGITHWHLCKYY